MQALRLLLLLGIGIGLFFFFKPSAHHDGPSQGIALEAQLIPAKRAAPRYCDLWTDTFRAQFSSSGATLKHFTLLTGKYEKGGEHLDLSTTPNPGFSADDPNRDDPNVKQRNLGHDREFRQQLFTQWRNTTVAPLQGVPFNLDFDSVDYRLSEASGKVCEFEYEDKSVRLTKRIEASERPYELYVTNTIKNLSSEPRSHAFAVDTVAWWLNSQVKGKMFRVSPYVTHVECQPEEGKAIRLLPDAFDQDDLQGPAFQSTQGMGWYEAPGHAAYAAVTNAYFAQALAPVESTPETKPNCQLQIEKRGAPDTPSAGAYYRARLAYPSVSLKPGQQASYSLLTYVGPKERNVLASAGGGQHRLDDLIDLGFFAEIAKVLVKFLLFVHSFIPNWGVAIIVLTITARLLLFPLSVPSIKNMVKMRELRPEIDALNEKYKDDPQAKGLAQMELWKKRGVNPMKGCLPQMASMPVWFALYTTLQTAVELYNIPFLWFPDLSESDPYFVLPFIIGGTYFLQQKLMPIQGGDPAQQKMMMYFMPGMFTVFMLFLPSGLGVYMFTNSVLAIVQQQAVEASIRRGSTASGKAETGTVPKSKEGGPPDSSAGKPRTPRSRRATAPR